MEQTLTANDLQRTISKAPLFTPFERSSLSITEDEFHFYCKKIFPEFKTNNLNLKAITAYLSRTDNKGWLFAGNTGTGKTTMSSILFRFMNCLEYRINGVLIDDNRLFSWRSVNAITIAEGAQRKGLPYIEELAKIINLHINDIGSEVRKGAEIAEVVYMGTRINPIEALLQLRGERKDLMTSATTNIPVSHSRFIDLYGDKVKSRLLKMCEYIEITGVDYRILDN
jgi:hypothetical protein